MAKYHRPVTALLLVRLCTEPPSPGRKTESFFQGFNLKTHKGSCSGLKSADSSDAFASADLLGMQLVFSKGLLDLVF